MWVIVRMVFVTTRFVPSMAFHSVVWSRVAAVRSVEVGQVASRAHQAGVNRTRAWLMGPYVRHPHTVNARMETVSQPRLQRPTRGSLMIGVDAHVGQVKVHKHEASCAQVHLVQLLPIVIVRWRSLQASNPALPPRCVTLGLHQPGPHVMWIAVLESKRVRCSVLVAVGLLLRARSSQIHNVHNRSLPHSRRVKWEQYAQRSGSLENGARAQNRVTMVKGLEFNPEVCNVCKLRME